MPVYVGSTVVFASSGTPAFPIPDTVNAPGTTLYSYNNDQGSYYSYWAYPGESDTPGAINSGSFQYRTIFTHGYVAAGYKGSNPWKSINRTWHATDITCYCGEQLDRGGAYIDGTWSDFNAYVHATLDSFQGASNWTSSYSLVTGVGRSTGVQTSSTTTGITATSAATEIYSNDSPTSTTSSGSGVGSDVAAGGQTSVGGIADFNLGGMPNPSGSGGDGGYAMAAARTTIPVCMTGQIVQQGFITGGGSTVTDRLHFPSEICYTGPASPYGSGAASAASGQSYGWGSVAGSKEALNFSSQTWSTGWTAPVTPDGQCKMLSTKWGYHYAGNGANVTSGFCQFSDVNGSSINNSLSKPYALGEENMEMGQDWGYCLGQYDGQQNNMTFKVSYSTSTCTVMGFATMPKGHVGQSSGCCSSAAMSICGTTAAGGY